MTLEESTRFTLVIYPRLNFRHSTKVKNHHR
jgi:hypothetical protein